MAGKSGKPKKRKKRTQYSEMVFQRTEDAAALLASFEAFRESIVEGLEKRHAPLLQEGETMPDYGLTLDLSAREVRLAIDHLVAVDDEHVEQKRKLEVLRSERDRLVKEEAYPSLVSVRGSIDAAFGREAGRRFHGMKGQTPRKMRRLGIALDAVAGWLESPNVRLPKTRSRGFGADREMWLEQLRGPRKLLADNAKALRGENKWEEKLIIDKSRSMDEFDKVYAHSLRLLQAMMVKARVGDELLSALYPLQRRREMHAEARRKRRARADAKAAAAAAEAEEMGAEADETGAEAAVETEGDAAPRKKAGRSSLSSWLRKGSA